MPARFAVLIFFILTLISCGGSKGPPIEHDFPLIRITDHVYVIHGPNEKPNAVNQGFTNNPGIVLIRGGVVVIDPGSSAQVGDMLLRKIATVSRDPVVAVFNTDLDGDHWLANQAIKAIFPRAVIYADPKMIAAMKVGGGDRIEQMKVATQGASRGTVAVVPDVPVNNDEVLKLHGTSFHFYHVDRADADSDLMIEVVEEKVIFLGDNVTNRRVAINLLEHGSIQAQIAAVDVALETRADHFVPGHGSSGGREIAQAERKFLEVLDGSVKKYRAQGMSELELQKKIMNELSAYRDWQGFENLDRVIHAAYRQAETSSF